MYIFKIPELFLKNVFELKIVPKIDFFETVKIEKKIFKAKMVKIYFKLKKLYVDKKD